MAERMGMEMTRKMMMRRKEGSLRERTKGPSRLRGGRKRQKERLTTTCSSKAQMKRMKRMMIRKQHKMERTKRRSVVATSLRPK